MATVMVQPQAVTTQTVTLSYGSGWSSGLLDCCDDCGICCCAFWCLPCLMCSTVHEFGECMCLPLLENCVGVGLTSLAMRTAVRERYRISGSICADCCALCFCYTCSWCQMAREIKRKKNFAVVTSQTTTVPLMSQVYM
ncbi:cornifelin homolog [Microcaecilia unicolor]|uniref:Cornifelin homolog n=1 Tax=Microcaecilia unicolor TaxID=1415580 RepID=A0A6P7WSK4_9AMPH|nr:cornifelin homolog [Microcaecilia unicolor]